MNINENDEDYSPVEPNKYQFLGLNNLTSGYDINISDKIENVYICAYRVNNKIKTPFLEYLLQTSNMISSYFFSRYFVDSMLIFNP